ncbi:hypothetical protein B0J18DRAFT_365313 [Chaetomium sp. MPI-SDFR-AT-0129]|nr:hypothetical protein B0J18DRAFT_365313 [Chaetomium sp. MPI-SDFR-AT-0129]
MASATQPVPETPVTIKVNIDGVARRFKLSLRDVGVNVLESKLRNALDIPADAEALFERYSDSAATYVVLDQANIAVYKQLYRAAKAKHKLKLRVTVKEGTDNNKVPEEDTTPAVQDESLLEPKEAFEEPIEDKTNSIIEPTDTEREPDSEKAADTSDDSEQLIKPMLEAMTEKLGALSVDVPETETSSTTQTCAVNCPAIHANYAVCCNSCDSTIPDAHYHCSTCDDGDYDLCENCVERGVTCNGTNHWLIKRFVKQGVIINSTTERLPPKPKGKPLPKQAPATSAPVAPERIIPVFNDNLDGSMRTCNCCVRELPEAEFVHCTSCDDFDLCRNCVSKNRHGHHPKHSFVVAVKGTKLDAEVLGRIGAGRGQFHSAVCDGCDKGIRGVRHKCLDCPDWDYCSGCVVNAGFIHPGHRFVPVYEPLEYDGGVRVRTMNRPVHMGICCDGPLCSASRANSSYIVGDRYKCAVCHDTDFCASCEASPSNSHNRTHPLIKFKSPVRHVSVTTTGENVNGRQMPAMGDRPRSRPSVTETQPRETSPASSLRTGIQTVVDVKPSLPRVKVEQPEEPSEKKPEQKSALVDNLKADFLEDTVKDGTVFGPDHVFEQTWILRNTGDVAWPPGCSVKFVGGDYMGHLDSNHPAATKDVEFSCESTICYASIQPGEKFPFSVLLRTPARSGRIVSYWRLTSKDGQKFGHRLWCDVVVKPKVVLPPVQAAEPVAQEKEMEVPPAPESEDKLEHSQMIFPKLEKESPVASVHEEANTESNVTGEDEYEDCEDAEWAEDASNPAFLTDDEYDILDASDEESTHGGRAH